MFWCAFEEQLPFTDSNWGCYGAQGYTSKINLCKDHKNNEEITCNGEREGRSYMVCVL